MLPKKEMILGVFYSCLSSDFRLFQTLDNFKEFVEFGFHLQTCVFAIKFFKRQSFLEKSWECEMSCVRVVTSLTVAFEIMFGFVWYV